VELDRSSYEPVASRVNSQSYWDSTKESTNIMDIFAFLLLYMSCTWTLADLKIGSLIVAISLLALCLLTRSPRGLF
jgi:hypothetical protein